MFGGLAGKGASRCISNRERAKVATAVFNYGERFTTIKDRRKEIGTGLLAAMIRQLGLSRDDI